MEDTNKADIHKKEEKEHLKTISAVTEVKKTLKINNEESKMKKEQKTTGEKVTHKTDIGTKEVPTTLKAKNEEKEVKESLEAKSDNKQVKMTLKTESGNKEVRVILKTDNEEKDVNKSLKAKSDNKKMKVKLKRESGNKKVSKALKKRSGKREVKETLETMNDNKKAKVTFKTESANKEVPVTWKNSIEGKEEMEMFKAKNDNKKEAVKLKTESGNKKVPVTLKPFNEGDELNKLLEAKSDNEKVKVTPRLECQNKEVPVTLKTSIEEKEVNKSVNAKNDNKGVKLTLKTETGDKEVPVTLKISNEVKEGKDSLEAKSDSKKVIRTLKAESRNKEVPVTFKISNEQKDVEESLEAMTDDKKVRVTLNTESLNKEVPVTLKISNEVKEGKESLVPETFKTRNEQNEEESLEAMNDNKKVKVTLNTESLNKEVPVTLKNSKRMEGKESLEAEKKGIKKVKMTLNTESLNKEVPVAFKTSNEVKEGMILFKAKNDNKKVKVKLKTESGNKKVPVTLKPFNEGNELNKLLEAKSDNEKVKVMTPRLECQNKEVPVTLKISNEENEVNKSVKAKNNNKGLKLTLKTETRDKEVPVTLKISNEVKEGKESLEAKSDNKKVIMTLIAESRNKEVPETFKTSNEQNDMEESLEAMNDNKKVKVTLNTESPNKEVPVTLKNSERMEVKVTLDTESQNKEVPVTMKNSNERMKEKESLEAEKGIKTVKMTLNTESLNKEVPVTLKTNEVKESVELRESKNDSKKVKVTLKTENGNKEMAIRPDSEKVYKMMEARNIEQDTFEKDAFIAESMESTCKLGHTCSSLQNIDNHIVPNVYCSEMDFQQSLLVKRGWDILIKEAVDAGLCNSGKAIELIEPFENQFLEIEVKSVSGIQQNTFEVEKLMPKHIPEMVDNEYVHSKSHNLEKVYEIKETFDSDISEMNTETENEQDVIETLEDKNSEMKAGENNVYVVEMVFNTEDTFGNDNFVAEPIKSSYIQAYSSLLNIANQAISDVNTSKMDVQQSLTVKTAWDTLIKEASDANFNHSGKEMELIELFKNQLLDMEIESKDGMQKNIHETNKTCVCETNEKNENDTERNSHFEKTSRKKIKAAHRLEREMHDKCLKKDVVEENPVIESGVPNCQLSNIDRSADIFQDTCNSSAKCNMQQQINEIKTNDRIKDLKKFSSTFAEHALIYDEIERQQKWLEMKKTNRANISSRDFKNYDKALTDEKRSGIRAKDRKCKADLYGLLSEPTQKGRQKIKFATAKSRLKITDPEKADIQARDRKHKADLQEVLTKSERKEVQIKKKLGMPRSRLELTEDKKLVIQAKDRKRKADHQELLSESERKESKKKAKLAQARHRLKLTDEEKLVIQAKDRKRKADHQELLSESERKESKKKAKLAQARHRLKLTDEEKLVIQAKDRKRKADHQELLSESERKESKKKAKLAQARHRLKLTDEEKLVIQAKDRKRKADHQELLSESERKESKKKARLAKARSRLKLTEDEKMGIQAKDRKHKALLQELLTESERKESQKKAKIAMARSRLKFTENEKLVIQAKDRKRKAHLQELLTESERKASQKKAKVAMARSRLKFTETEKLVIQAKDRKRKADLQELLTEPEKKESQKKKKMTQAQRRLKLTEDEKSAIQGNDRRRKAEIQLKLDESMKENKKIQERSRKHRKRCSLSESESKAIETFHALVKEGPVFVCTSCHRLLYRESVNIFDETDYSKCDETLLRRCVSGYLHSDNREYICQTCQWNLKRNKLPAQSVGNALQLDDIPEELQNLSALESMLISKRVPFMKVLALPRGKQRAIHGCVVNVPVNPEETYSVLPRLPSSSSIITVKLKRKLQYRGHVIKQSVRPWRVLQALYHLKHTAKNHHYRDVEINEHWDEDAAHDNEELWSSMTAKEELADENSFHIKPSDVDKMESSTDDINDSDQEEENCDQEETAQLRGLPFDSCLEPKDISSDKDLLLSIAPGEGKKPVSLYSDKNNEELAFPTLFPKGRFGWDHKRDQKLSLKKYFNTRLLNADGRFSQSTEYLFYAQYRCEAEDVANSLSIGLRKCKGKVKNITAGQIKDAEEIRKLIRNDLSIHFLQKVRGSPAYYNKLLFDLLGMVRQLGNCTWFLTLSAADLKWTDTIQIIAAQNGQHLSDQEVDSLTWEQKCLWLRTNPVTAARHFDHRLQAFMKTLILGKSHPIGQIQDYKYRIEFQQRGSPHAHMLIWVKDAPQVKDSPAKEVSKFVDKYITCSVPSDDDNLAELVTTVQKHSHSAACRKPGKSCRFAFPRPPLEETTVLYPAEEPVTEQAKTIFSDTLTAVYEKLSSLEPNTDPSLADILEDLEIPLALYLKALQWIKTKQGRPAVLLKRKPIEGCINFYNPVLLKAWQANMDIQIVDHVESCIMYVSSYISKPEKTLGDVLKSVSKSCEPQGPKKMMQMVSKKFLSHREVSAQEAVYRVLSLPLIRGSRQVIFVPTDLPENRTKLLKPLKIIQELDDEEEDLYMTGMLEKYADRPHSVENLCLADFASYYCYGGKPKANEPELKDFPGSDVDEDPNVEDLEALPKTIQLQTTKAKLRRRSKPAIIRTHQFSQQQQEEFYHSKLLLYLPWRNEENDLKGDDGTFKSKFITKFDAFTTKMTEYEPNSEEYNRAVQNLMENGPPEDSWATLAAQTEQERSEDRQEGPTDDPDFSAIAPPQDAQPADLGLQHAEYDHELSGVSTQEWLNMILSLNAEQKPVHQFVLEWCTNMSLTYKTAKRPDSFHLFLTGGAGVGKSHVIKTIVQTARRRLNVGQSEDDVTVMVCAYMGSAAFNVEGYTLHSSFHLPLNESKQNDYIRLSNEQLSTMRSKLGNLCLLIIDEISMVGSDQLLSIHRRLAEIMNSDEPFGGVSVLAVGDLYQLPPVGHFPIYTPPSDTLAALYGSLWKKHFKIIELTQIMRQKNDVQFANALNRFRTEEQTEEDIELIKTRQVDNLGVPAPPEALHIYALNDDVDAHNEKMLNSLGGQIITIRSIDSKTDQQTGRIENVSLGKKASGLWEEIKLSIGARVMLTKNVDVTDGLANTAMGTLTGFIPPPPASDHPDFSSYRPKYILVHFDEERVGRRRRQKLKHLVPDGVSVPIAAIEVLAKYKRVSAKRLQFPLALAWAITIHKAQGKTVNELVVSMKGSFRCGQLYTALSRVKTIDGLYILGEFQASKVRADTRSKEEMARLRLHSPFKVSIPATFTASPSLFFKMSVININSLKPHFKCLAVDRTVVCSDVVTLTETWLRPTDATADFSLPDKHLLRQDSKQTACGRNGGIATYLDQQYRLIQRYQIDVPQLQHLSLLLHDRADPAARLLIITLYNPPNVACGTFHKQLDKLLTRLPCDSVPTILCGDFNVNSLKEDNASKSLASVTQYYGFRQYVSTMTHRAGAALDHVYVNKNLHHSLSFTSTPIPYTDHFHVQIAVPYRELFL